MENNKKPQVRRYSDLEIEIIKGVFEKNQDLYFTLRKVFLQFPLKKDEEKLLKKYFTKDSEALRILKKTFYPEIDIYAPITQVVDLWLVLGIEIKDKSPEEAQPYIDSNKIFMQYLSEQFYFFTEDGESKLKFSELTPQGGSEDFIRLHARNRLISFIDNQLGQLQFFANMKLETVEETKSRLAKDSTK